MVYKATLLGLVLVLAGCNISSDGKAAPSQTGSSQKVAAKIGYIPIADHMLVGVADELYGDELLKVDIDPLRFTNYPTMSEALRSGDLDGAFLLAPLAFQVKLAGAPVKIVLLGHRDGSGLVVDKAKNITEFKALDQQTVAIPHRFSTNNFLMHYHGKTAHQSETIDIKTIEAGPPEMFSALNTGNIDGYITAEPFLAEAELSGVGEVLIFTSEIWKGHPDCVLVLREDYIEKNPDAVQELITSMVKAANHVEADRMGSAAIASRFLGKNIAVMKHSLRDRRRVTFENLVPVNSELERMQNYMADEMGLFPRKVDMNEIVEDRFARKAYATIQTNEEE